MGLVVGATLFIGTLAKLYALDRGFEADNVLVVKLMNSRFPRDRAVAVQQDVLDRLRSLPGVRSASAAQALPAGGWLLERHVEVEGGAALFVPDAPPRKDEGAGHCQEGDNDRGVGGGEGAEGFHSLAA